MPPQRHRSRCSRPSEHRRGRSARKAAPAPKPVGAARSGRSLLNGVQQLSRRPGIDRPCFCRGDPRGTDVNSVIGNSRLGGAGGTTAVRSVRSANSLARLEPGRESPVRPSMNDSSRDPETQPEPRRGSGRLNAATKQVRAMQSNNEHTFQNRHHNDF